VKQQIKLEQIKIALTEEKVHSEMLTSRDILFISIFPLKIVRYK